MFLSLTNNWQCVYRWHLILTKFSVFWQRTADADKQNCWKLHSFVRFVHSFVRLSSWCWQIKFFLENGTALCYLCTALCYLHSIVRVSPCWWPGWHSFVLISPYWWFISPWINPWDHRWWSLMSDDIPPHEDCRWES